MLDEMIHDVNSKCGALKSAAALLRDAADGERQELLSLMVKEAEDLARDLTDFARKAASGGHPNNAL